MKEFIKRKLKSSTLIALIGTIFLVGINDKRSDAINTINNKAQISYISKQQLKFDFAYLIKSFLMLPLWVFSSVILKLLEPLKSFVLSFLFTFFALSLIVLLVAKMLFPKLKIKDIFTKRNVLIIVAFSLLINLSKYLLLLIDKNLLKYSLLVYLILGFVCLIIITFPLIKLAKQIENLRI